MIKKIALPLIGAALLALAPLPAAAHCGGCGVGDEKSADEECAAKCAPDADKEACIDACKQKHEESH